MSSLKQGVLFVFGNIAVGLTLLDLLVLDRLLDVSIVLGEELLGLESCDAART